LRASTPSADTKDDRPKDSMISRRHNVALVVALFAVLVPASAGARTTSVRFASLPKRFVQNGPTSVVASVHPASVCNLSVRYADGEFQPGLGPAGTSNGRAKWTFRVSGGAAPGHAKVSVSCAPAGSVQRTVLVVGSVIPARIAVVKSGWSVRQPQFVGGKVSYGVILQNTSPNQDALQVYALVNFVGPDSKLVGSATTNIAGIPAGQQFALGGDITFPAAVPPIARLEIVVHIDRRQPHALKLATISNIYLEPSVLEPAWLGAVDGEVSNPEAALLLENTSLSTVVFDADGNVIGGGTGFAGAPLPPGSREFFKIMMGNDIAMSKAASAMISAIGSYRSP
jgi:hypothetical protein